MQPVSPNLPPIRPDITLQFSGHERDGTPTWILYDRVRELYLRIGWVEYEIIKRWGMGTPKQILKDIRKNTTLSLPPAVFEKVYFFLEDHELLFNDSDEKLIFGYIKYRAKKTKWASLLLKNYLFFKIPFLRPTAFLEKTMPVVRLFISKKMVWLLLFVFIISLFLIMRQWPTFINSYDYFFSFENLVYLFGAIILIKFLHEFGHGYAATYFNCPVNTIGLAFLVLFPVLYTDITSTWRLKKRKQRVWIAGAGIITELSIAIISMLLWGLSPPGVMKSLYFYIITISWVSTLLINLNPLLKFDGYHLLSDLLAVDNLQQQAFKLGRWKLRQWLLDENSACPIRYDRFEMNTMLVYCYFTWIYRFFLFLGIAIMVYYFFFKVLGIILMIAEIWYFIVSPICKEIAVYWSSVKEMSHITGRAILSFCCLLTILFALVYPWKTRVSVPAQLEFKYVQNVYVPFPGKITSIQVKQNQSVNKDQILATMEAPDLNYHIQQTKFDITHQKEKLSIEQGKGVALGLKQATLEELNSKTNELDGFTQEKAKLIIKSPLKGNVLIIKKNLHLNQWLDTGRFLFTVGKTTSQEIIAYVPEEMFHRVHLNAHAIFYPDDTNYPPLKGVVARMDKTRSQRFMKPYLDSQFGGVVGTIINKSQGTKIKDSFYRIIITFSDKEAARLDKKVELRGEVQIRAKAESILGRVFKSAYATFVRESGF